MNMKLLAMALVAVALPVAVGAQRTSGVGQARAAGEVGERFDGYLGLVSVPPEAVRRQVGAINIRRRALYSDLARRRGVAAQDVGVTAACALLGRVAVGESYLFSDGVWRRRAAGQAAPRPTYCGG